MWTSSIIYWSSSTLCWNSIIIYWSSSIIYWSSIICWKFIYKYSNLQYIMLELSVSPISSILCWNFPCCSKIVAIFQWLCKRWLFFNYQSENWLVRVVFTKLSYFCEFPYPNNGWKWHQVTTLKCFSLEISSISWILIFQFNFQEKNIPVVLKLRFLV